VVRRRTPPSHSAANEALALVPADPARATASAEAALAHARRTRDVAEEVVAERALGMAAREMYDAARAVPHLRRAVRLAERHGLAERAAEARMGLAVVVEELGRPAAALREVDRALAALHGLPRARARMQRAIILRRLGREQEALAAYGAALASFRRGGDRLWQARALTNRGVLHAYRGALRQAEADLRAAAALHASLDLPASLAQVHHNLGFVAAQASDVPQALTWYDKADEFFQRNGRPAVALLDRAELLLAARLFPEARQAAQDAVDSCLQSRLGSLLPQARLLLAQAALGAGDREAARAAAQSAGRAFRRQGRERWAALSSYIDWQAAGAPVRGDRVRRLAATLDANGWAVPALEATIAAASASAAPDVRAALDRAGAAAVRGGPVRLRIRGWYARALARWYAGDRPGARRAALAGLRLVDGYRAALGATELRVHVSAEGADLAALGLRLALADRAGRSVFGWAERWRAATLRLPAQPLSYDDEAAHDLAALRRVDAELTAGPADPQRLRRLTRRQRALEESVRRRTWRTSGSRAAGPAGTTLADIRTALGDRALVEIVEADGQVWAVVVVAGRVHLRPLCTVDAAGREVRSARFALRRLAVRHGALAAMAEMAEHALGTLDRLLLAPVQPLLGDRPLVIVPSGPMHSLPWPALPSCRGRPVAVAPSAGAWWRAETATWWSALTEVSTVDDPVVFVATEDPPHAIAEVDSIVAHVPAATVLRGPSARSGAVLAALDGAPGAHLATHGVFRADNPLFSYLRLADGPLTVHDLMRLRRPPRLVVLSACDTGLSAVHPGDELMGLASALLSLGTRSLVASVGPVDDEATKLLMVDLHRRLARGIAPAVALAAAQAQADPTWWASTYSFVCFGAG